VADAALRAPRHKHHWLIPITVLAAGRCHCHRCEVGILGPGADGIRCLYVTVSAASLGSAQDGPCN
jgi:hypothetical protein